jgi:hypothetical protein
MTGTQGGPWTCHRLRTQMSYEGTLTWEAKKGLPSVRSSCAIRPEQPVDEASLEPLGDLSSARVISSVELRMASRARVILQPRTPERSS